MGEALNKSLRRVISRAWAVCCVEFFANSGLLVAKSALHSIPIRLPRIRKNCSALPEPLISG
ncbi:hypothetical protein [Polaromonas eurypsychrophila]